MRVDERWGASLTVWGGSVKNSLIQAHAEGGGARGFQLVVENVRDDCVEW